MRRKTDILVVALILALCATCWAESASLLLEKGLFEEETKGDLDAAIAVYKQIIDDPEAGQTYVAQALYRLGMCHVKKKQDDQAVEAMKKLVTQFPANKELVGRAEKILDQLLTLDPASLMPPETFYYVEVGSPGIQLEKILKMLQGTPFANPLAVMGAKPGPGGDEKSPSQILAALLNPSMLKEFKKIRGMAVGITDLKKGRSQPCVAVLQPGESDALRGILTAALLGAGQPADPIEGMQTVQIAGQAACAFDDDVIIIAIPPEQLASCIKRYKGIVSEPTLASANTAFSSLATREARKQNALTIWCDPARGFSRLRAIAGKREIQKFDAIDRVVDFKNIRGAVVGLAIDEKNPYIEATLSFKEGHECLAYQIIRTPHLSMAAFEAVPAEAVAVASIALNELGPGSERSDSARRAIKQLTGLDVGREIFANIEQVTLFAIPPTEAILQNNLSKKEGPIPFCFGLAVTSRNPHQTRELLDKLLSIPEIIFSSASSPEESGQGHQGDQLQSKYLITDDKYYCHVGQVGRTNVLAMDPVVLAASMTAAKSGDNAVKSGPLHLALSQMAPGTGKLVTVNAGGALQLALAQMQWETASGRTGADQHMQLVSKLSEVFAETNVQLRTVENPNSLTLRVGLDNLPPLAEVFPLVMQLAQHRSARPVVPQKARHAGSPDFTKLPENKGLALKVLEKSKWNASGWMRDHAAVSGNYSTEIKDAAMRFTINDSNALKVWVRYFDKPVDYKHYPILVLRYRGTNLAEKGMYNIWMDDGTGPDSGGFTLLSMSHLVTDGELHEIRRDLREFNPKGSITGLALGMMSGEQTPATYDLISLHFEVPSEGEPVEAPSQEETK